ncbi:MAG TPA: calcium-binding protein [Rubrobacteraceae bacterium]|nr:calcium-binding protein [Rubrobacteraceae bacterium]
MTRAALLTTVMMLAIFLSSGVAWAAMIRCDGGVCRGTNSGDQMNGSARSDRMYGLAGIDVMNGNRDNDLMYGGGAADRMFGGYGNDRIYGQYLNDMIDGGPASDRIFGGSGRDTLYGGTGNDFIFAADNQFDSIDCGGGADVAVIDFEEDQMSLNVPLIDYITLTRCETIRYG